MQQFEFNDVMYLPRNTTADKTLNETSFCSLETVKRQRPKIN